MNRAVSPQQLEGHSEELCKMEGFYRKKDGAKELFTKEEEELFLVQDNFFFGGGGMVRVFIIQIVSSFYGEWRGPR